ncbi:MAG TPA: M48 family metallopeptidase [Candidatus Paceibacterota bacterium]|nr:M48 family metallopeptidase [Candidatus Paceibacterota bacterium]
MTNLYDFSQRNVFKTWILLIGFVALVCGLGYLLSHVYDEPVIFYVAVVISLFQVWRSYWFSKDIILRSVNAHKATKEDNPYINDIVENLAITVGLPTPEVYVIDDPAPNAFATGRNPKNSAICVTTGLLNLFATNPDGSFDLQGKRKLEGVLAHELSHIKNYDILLASVAATMVSVIWVIINLVSRSGRPRRSNNNDSGSLLWGILALLALILAPLAATLLQMAISRKREYVADANAGIITRFPEGLAEALEEIEQDSNKLNVPSNVQSLFIASPLKNDSTGKRSWFVGLFDTHPPIEDRIKVLRSA